MAIFLASVKTYENLSSWMLLYMLGERTKTGLYICPNLKLWRSRKQEKVVGAPNGIVVAVIAMREGRRWGGCCWHRVVDSHILFSEHVKRCWSGRTITGPKDSRSFRIRPLKKWKGGPYCIAKLIEPSRKERKTKKGTKAINLLWRPLTLTSKKGNEITKGYTYKLTTNPCHNHIHT